MGGFFGNLSYRLQQFMIGRYGFDALGKFTVIFSLILYGVSVFLGIGILYPISMLLLVWAYFRMFSKNIYKRRVELDKYMGIRNKVMGKINLRKQMWRERKMYKYFTCPKCKSVWRFPKGKGKIEITCKNCRHKMIKRT